MNILYVLSMSFVDLSRARAAISAGVETSKAAADFGYKGREFAMRNAFRGLPGSCPSSSCVGRWRYWLGQTLS